MAGRLKSVYSMWGHINPITTNVVITVFIEAGAFPRQQHFGPVRKHIHTLTYTYALNMQVCPHGRLHGLTSLKATVIQRVTYYIRRLKYFLCQQSVWTDELFFLFLSSEPCCLFLQGLTLVVVRQHNAGGMIKRHRHKSRSVAARLCKRHARLGRGQFSSGVLTCSCFFTLPQIHILKQDFYL